MISAESERFGKDHKGLADNSPIACQLWRESQMSEWYGCFGLGLSQLAVRTLLGRDAQTLNSRDD